RRNRQGNPLQNLNPPRSVLNPLLRIPNFNHPQPSVCSPFPYTINVDVPRRSIVSFLVLLLACPALAADRPVLVCFGDSITAGYGLYPGQTFPDMLQRDLDNLGYNYKVDNQGTSGATTKDAVADLNSILQLHPDVVIVEFGGNDGLRGLPLDQTR